MLCFQKGFYKNDVLVVLSGFYYYIRTKEYQIAFIRSLQRDHRVRSESDPYNTPSVYWLIFQTSLSLTNKSAEHTKFASVDQPSPFCPALVDSWPTQLHSSRA
jgi:hypothetical protein